MSYLTLTNVTLEDTIDKILRRSENELIDSLKKLFEDSKKILTDSLSSLEHEHDRIISEGKKEADKLQKQMIGSSSLEERNKQIVLMDKFVERVFDKAIENFSLLERDEDYTNFMTKLVDEAIKSLRTSKVDIVSNSKDKELVKSILKKFDGATLLSDTIECTGGIIVKSKDGSMSIDNTIEARLERLKPVIRKDIATKFGS